VGATLPINGISAELSRMKRFIPIGILAHLMFTLPAHAFECKDLYDANVRHEEARNVLDKESRAVMNNDKASCKFGRKQSIPGIKRYLKDVSRFVDCPGFWGKAAREKMDELEHLLAYTAYLYGETCKKAGIK
jgi:hypothetical protein